VPLQGKTLVISGEKYGEMAETQFDLLHPEISRPFKIRKSGNSSIFHE
jgi:hypothetical protein